MENKKAIDLLDNLIGMIEDNNESDYDTALKMGINSLKNSVMIPASERVPEKDGEYLVQYEHGMMAVISWADGWNCYRSWDKTIIRNHEIDGVVAWMPLPEPAKEA